MNPPALSLPRDVKQPDRPQPRDPQAAGGPSRLSGADGPDEPFQALVDEAGKDATAAGNATSASGEDRESAAKGMAGATEANGEKAADEQPKTATGALPIILTPPHPPLPPTPQPNGQTATGDSLQAPLKAGEHKAEHLTHAGREMLKNLPDATDPKKQGSAAAPATENFANLLTDAKNPAEPQAVQAGTHAAPFRPTEPPLPAPPQPVPPPLPIVALPATIAIKAMEGTNRFDIRLDPEDLGRIDVSLQIDHDGNIRAAIAAEKPEALQLIVREARALEQAFDQAGFRRDNDALSFSLSDQQQSSHRREDSPDRQKPHATRFFVEGDAELPKALTTVISRADGRLDVRI